MSYEMPKPAYAFLCFPGNPIVLFSAFHMEASVILCQTTAASKPRPLWGSGWRPNGSVSSVYSTGLSQSWDAGEEPITSARPLCEQS